MSIDAQGSGGILPYLALILAQLITSSWHVLGKHVMSQVPYLTPIAFVLIRTGITGSMLLTFGRIFEGSVAMPLLFCDNSTISDDEENGCVDEKQVVVNGNYVGELQSMNGYDGPKHNPIKRRRRKKTVWREQFKILRIYIIANTAQRRSTSATAPSINPEILQILGASLAGMLLLPLCYTTGLILTNPTVASVWDGPMIPLGVFFTAIGLGVEKLSRKRPLGQVLSLLLTVGGSVIVLCADFLGPHNSLKDEDGATI